MDINNKTQGSELENANLLIDEALKGKSENFKTKVLDFVLSCRIDPEDPLFLLLIAMGNLDQMLVQTPKALEVWMENWIRELSKTLDLVETISIQRQNIAISNAAKEVVGKVIDDLNFQESRKLLSSIIPALLILTVTLTFGVFTGMMFPPWLRGILNGGYSQIQGDNLTWKEVNAMHWALSKEGKLAKKIIDWNRGYLDTGRCLADTEKLGISLSEYGREAESGYCVIWVTPVEKRKFKPQ